VKTSIPKDKLLLVGLPVFGLLLGLLGYMALVAPQNSKASSLSNQIVAAKAAAARAKAQPKSKPKPVPVHAADIYGLTKAMPDSPDISSVLLDLQRVSAESRVVLQSVTFAPPVPLTGYGTLPTTVVVAGTFPTVSNFLHRLRREVWVDKSGRVHSDDRLLIADGVNLSQSAGLITASLTMNAFVYGLSAPAPTTTTTGSTTTTTTTTPSGGG